MQHLLQFLRNVFKIQYGFTYARQDNILDSEIPTSNFETMFT